MNSFIWEKLRQYGFVGFFICLLEKILVKVLRISIHKYYIYEHDISGDIPEYGGGYEVRELTFKDFVEQRPKAPDWFSQWKMRNLKYGLLKCKNCAIGIFDGELLVAYGLIDFNHMLTFHVELKKNDVYFWDEYVNKNYRGRNIFCDLQYPLIHKCKSLGKERVLSYVDSYNKASHNAHKKAGYSVIQSFIEIHGWGKHYSSMKLPL